MFTAVEAIVENGHIHLLEPLKVPEGTHAIITFLTGAEREVVNDTAFLSESSLSDWNRPEEEKAWAYLQKGRKFLYPIPLAISPVQS